MISEKYASECLAEGFEYIGKSDRRNYSVVKCNVCGYVDEYQQTNIRLGKVKCSHCQITKYKSSVKPDWTFMNHFRDGSLTFVNLKHNCCNDLVKVQVSAYLRDSYDCPHCQIIKYKSSVKPTWTFVNHFCDGRQTYVNLKHNCCDDLVKVQTSHYLRGEYDCPHCSHTHFNDPSYFYVIQVGTIVKLGISNRPDQRYTQYGLPDDATIIEHLRIPLESKRDALVVESYAKQLVKDYKIHTDIAKQIFTKSGCNECYSIESLEYLLTI